MSAASNNQIGRRGSFGGIYDFAEKPQASAGNAGTQIFVRDVGIGGSYWYSDGTRWRAVNNALWLHNNPADVAHSGSVGSELMGQVYIPPGVIQQGDMLEWHLVIGANILPTSVDAFYLRLGTTGSVADAIINNGVSQPNTTSYLAGQNKRVRRTSVTEIMTLDAYGASGLGMVSASAAPTPVAVPDLDANGVYLSLYHTVNAVVASRVPVCRAFSVELITGGA